MPQRNRILFLMGTLQQELDLDPSLPLDEGLRAGGANLPKDAKLFAGGTPVPAGALAPAGTTVVEAISAKEAFLG